MTLLHLPSVHLAKLWRGFLLRRQIISIALAAQKYAVKVSYSFPLRPHSLSYFDLTNVQNAATHPNNLEKVIVNLLWVPPSGFVGDVVFK